MDDGGYHIIVIFYSSRYNMSLFLNIDIYDIVAVTSLALQYSDF